MCTNKFDLQHFTVMEAAVVTVQVCQQHEAILSWVFSMLNCFYLNFKVTSSFSMVLYYK